MEVIHPNLRRPAQVVGVEARILHERSLVIDTGPPEKEVTFIPKGVDVTVVLTDTGSEVVTVAGETITIEFNGGVTTVGTIQGLVATHPDAADLLTVDGTPADVIQTGGTVHLWGMQVIPPMAMLVKDADGNWVPFSGDSISVTFKEALETTYDVVTVDLGTARAALTSVWTGDATDVTIWSLDGTCSLAFNAATNDEHPLTPLTWPSMIMFGRVKLNEIFVKNVLQAGKKLVMRIGRTA